MSSNRYGDWIQLHSGKPFFPLDPRPEEIDIDDIAWSLAHQCRYNGHTNRFYSVAEHCVHISFAVPLEQALWGLLHDASEAYLSDLPRPLKPFIPDYKVCEDRLMRCVAELFSLPWPEPAIVKELDTRILHNERAALMTPSALEWNIPGGSVPGIEIHGWQPKEAYTHFIGRYTELTTSWDGHLHEQFLEARS